MPFVTDSDQAGRADAHFSRRAVAALAAGIGLLLIAGLSAGFLAYRTGVAEGWADHSVEIRNETQHLMFSAVAMQSSVRGYLLTGEDGFLTPYKQAAATMPAALDHLRQLVADNPRQLEGLAQISSTLSALSMRYQSILDLLAAGERQQAIDSVRRGGEQFMNAVRQEVDAFAEEELKLLEERRAAARDLRRWSLFLVFSALLAATILTVELSRWMLHYVNRLVAQSAELRRETQLRRESEATLVQSQKMEAVGLLAGGIAHDFNNMLTIILGNLTTVLRRLGQAGDASPAIVQPLESAVRGARSAAKLTHRLLAFSRRQPLAPTQADLNRVVADVAELVRRSVGESVELETVLAAGLWLTVADVHQLENVLVNLVVNARDAMPDGGRVTIETSNAYLDETYAAAFGDVVPGQYVLLSVTDSGHGIAPEMLDRVFDPFVTTKPEGQGSGLGLAMTHGFVKQSGGHIRLYSELGEGTTVKIYLPRLLDAERVPAFPAAHPEAEGRADFGGTETLLVVEDNEGVRNYARAALEEVGYTVVAAIDTADALAKLAQGTQVDLLFTDVVLGRGPSGRELADQLAAQGLQLPVLFTTGYSRNAIFHNGRLDAGVDLLEKPYTQRELVRRIRSLLNRRPPSE